MKNSKKIIKKISLILSLLMLLSFATGCSNMDDNTDGVEAPDGMVGVTNDAIHFSVCYPQSWICDRNDGMVTMSPSVSSGSKASVSVAETAALAEETTAEDYWDKCKDELENSGSKCNFIERKERKIGGVDAIEAIYGMEVGGTVYKVTQIFAYKYIDSSHRVFTITFTGTEADYENKDITSAFNSIVGTFAFKG